MADTVACPQCGAEVEDHDGMGWHGPCAECDHCDHPAITGNRCDACRRDVRADVPAIDALVERLRSALECYVYADRNGHLDDATVMGEAERAIAAAKRWEAKQAVEREFEAAKRDGLIR